MRIQNEGTGKSSWWVLNPDAKPGKTPSRRRVNSMDHKNFEKRRGRVKKKMEALQAAIENSGGTLSPNSTDDILESLNFTDFRPRASSNASSCGRLSPIHATHEADLHDNQVPPMSPLMWGSEMNNSPSGLFASDGYTDLVDCLGDGMKLSQEKIDLIRDPYLSSEYTSQPSNFMEVEGQSQDGQFGQLPAPPPYPKQQPQINGLEFKDFKDFNGLQSFNIVPQYSQSSPENNPSSSFSQTDNLMVKPEPERISPMLMQQVNSLTVNTQQQTNDSQQVSPNNSALFQHLSPGSQVKQEPLKQIPCQGSNQKLQQQHLPLRLGTPSTPQVALQQASILREALTRGPPSYRPIPQTPGYTPIPGSLLLQSNANLSPMTLSLNNGLNGLSSSLSPHHQLSSISENVDAESLPDSGRFLSNNVTGVPQDIDLDLIEAFDCDMDQVNVNQVIKRELDLEGKLDFNFESVGNPIGQNVVH